MIATDRRQREVRHLSKMSIVCKPCNLSGCSQEDRCEKRGWPQKNQGYTRYQLIRQLKKAKRLRPSSMLSHERTQKVPCESKPSLNGLALFNLCICDKPYQQASLRVHNKTRMFALLSAEVYSGKQRSRASGWSSSNFEGCTLKLSHYPCKPSNGSQKNFDYAQRQFEVNINANSLRLPINENNSESARSGFGRPSLGHLHKRERTVQNPLSSIDHGPPPLPKFAVNFKSVHRPDSDADSAAPSLAPLLVPLKGRRVEVNLFASRRKDSASSGSSASFRFEEALKHRQPEDYRNPDKDSLNVEAQSEFAVRAKTSIGKTRVLTHQIGKSARQDLRNNLPQPQSKYSASFSQGRFKRRGNTALSFAKVEPGQKSTTAKGSNQLDNSSHSRNATVIQKHNAATKEQRRPSARPSKRHKIQLLGKVKSKELPKSERGKTHSAHFSQHQKHPKRKAD